MAKKRWSIKSLSAMLGPGLVTGAADDDPSGIATYSQGGAQFGYALGWTMFLTTPFMIAIQMVSARIGAVTGQGLAANIAKALPRLVLHGIVGLLLLANTLNIAADIAAMGDALRLIAGGPVLVYIALFGIGCLAAEILIPYHIYSGYLKLLTLVLFAYVGAAFSVRIPWGEVAAATFVPQLSWTRDFTLMLVAIFGTTISPYMFFWQASLEAEERKLRAKMVTKTVTTTITPNRKQLRERDATRIGVDTATGMIFSNLIGFFIIITTAATLHAHGTTNIGTAAQAAEALRPLARRTGAGGVGGLCGGGKLRLGRQPRIAGQERAGLLSDRRRGHARRTGRGAHAARSDPHAVLERRRQRRRRRAADGRDDGGGNQPQDHGQVRGFARLDDRRLERHYADGRGRRRHAGDQRRPRFRRCRLTIPTAANAPRRAAAPGRLASASR
jgi:NRAMP (natural resistance-associated macrophage protein)-like metal ion transporter